MWLIFTALDEGTLHREALAVGHQDNDTLGEKILDKGTLAVVSDLGKSALAEVAETDRLFPCTLLFLVSPYFLNFLMIFPYIGQRQLGEHHKHHLQLEHRLKILPRHLRRRLRQEGSARPETFQTAVLACMVWLHLHRAHNVTNHTHDKGRLPLCHLQG